MPPPPPPEHSLIALLIEEVSKARSEATVQTRELIVKIESYQAESRQEFKEMRADVTDILVRLAQGSEKIKSLQKDVESSHAQHLAIKPKVGLVAGQYTNTEDSEETIKIKRMTRKMPWWQVAIGTAALTYVVPTLLQSVINSLATKEPTLPPQQHPTVQQQRQKQGGP